MTDIKTLDDLKALAHKWIILDKDCPRKFGAVADACDDPATAAALLAEVSADWRACEGWINRQPNGDDGAPEISGRPHSGIVQAMRSNILTAIDTNGNPASKRGRQWLEVFKAAGGQVRP